MAKVTLELDGPTIPVDRFLSALEALLTLLREIDRELGDRGEPSLGWIISGLRSGSAHVSVAPQPRIKKTAAVHAQRVIQAAAAGLAKLEHDGDRRPRHFSDGALEAARTLTQSVGTHKERLVQVRVRFGPKQLQLTERTAATVEQLIGPQSKSLGSVEGRLEVISIHGREHFRILDRVTQRTVACYFQQGDLNTVWAMFGKRVAVYGILRSRASGEPISIEVKDVATDVTVFPPEDELPTPREVRGLLAT